MINTPFAIVLLARLDSEGLIRIPRGNLAMPGLLLQLDPHTSLARQVPAFLARELGEPDLLDAVRVTEIIYPSFEIPEMGEATLVLSTSSARWPAGSNHSLLPQILREMPKIKARVPYMKALQHLMGADNDRIDAVEVTRDELLKLAKESKNTLD